MNRHESLWTYVYPARRLGLALPSHRLHINAHALARETRATLPGRLHIEVEQTLMVRHIEQRDGWLTW